MFKKISIVPKFRAVANLEAMLLSSAITVFVIYNFLAVNYADPLTTHICQLLIGVFSVLVAVVLVLTIFGKYIDIISAVLAGFGLGIIVEELVNFTTLNKANVAAEIIPIVYFVFITLFFLGRFWLVSRIPFKKDYLVNCMELIQDALVTDEKDKIAYEQADFLLKKVGTKNSTAQHLNQLVHNQFDILSPVAENSFSKKLERWYGFLLGKKLVEILLVTFFVLLIGFNSYYLLLPILGGWSFDLSSFSRFELLLFVSTAFVVLVTLGGMVEILVDRRNNYKLLELALYLSIFFQEVYIFDVNRFYGAVVLIVSFMALFLIKYMICLEERYARLYLLGRK